MKTLCSSTLDLFAGELTLCAEAFPVSRSVSPGKAQAKTTAATSGLKCSASSTSADLLLSSLRTYLACEVGAQTTCCVIWKRQATPQGRSWWVLTTSAIPIGAKEFGLWRTPNQRDWHPNKRGNYRREDGQEQQLDLPNQTMMWPTPTVQDGENIAGSSQERRKAVPLNTAARLWPTATVCGNYNRKGASLTSGDGLATTATKLWPTPQAFDSNDIQRSPEALARAKTKGGCANLREVVTRFASPPDPTITDLGQLLQKWNRPSCPVLNPKFCQWLMSYPPDWFEGVDAPETPRSKR
jgi:hypothetical protein